MGKGFDVFMENEYWRQIYNEAPSDNLRKYYQIMFDISPYVMGDEYKDEQAETELKQIRLTKIDISYMQKNTTLIQAKMYYQRCMNKLTSGNEGSFIPAFYFRGEIRTILSINCLPG